MKHPNTLALGALLSLSWAGAAHAKDSAIPGPNSFVRVLHAVSGGPKVDIYVDGQKKLNDVTFSSITKYLRFSSGRHRFTIVSNNPTRTLFSRVTNLRAGDFYTVGAFGTRSRSRFFSANDSAFAVPYNRGLVTLFHLAPGAPAVNVSAVNKNGTSYVLARRLPYGASRAVSVPAVPLTLRVTANGRILKTITGAAPRAGRKYAAYAIGVPAENFRVMVVSAASQ